jgi:hypothetical protein
VSNHLLYLNAQQDTAKGFQFGLHIPFLPDFLLDHTLLGKEPSDRIVEHTRRWNQFVSGLWGSTNDVTYALRFDLDLIDKKIDTYILGRLRALNTPEAVTQAEILLKDLERMLEAFGFEPSLLTTNKLKSLLQNYNYSRGFEVCQEEVATPTCSGLQK